MNPLEKTDFLIQIQIKKSIYLMKLLRILSLPLYHTRLSFAMIKISHESIVKLKLDRRESYCWEILPQKEQ